MYPRKYKYPELKSFFVFGPRGTGKTTWLKSQFKDAAYVDLLNEETFQHYLLRPNELESLSKKNSGKPILIDEIQRLPNLLNEVHRLIESNKQRFILTGSSSRKLKKAGTNLLAGRARVLHFHPLLPFEIGNHFNLKKALKFGSLPSVWSDTDPGDYLKAYFYTYIREEIIQEAIVRNIAIFSRFLEAAAFSHATVLSVSNTARDLGVDPKTAEHYFRILEDLLLAVRLPVFHHRAQRKITQQPKFYFFDTGVYRTLRTTGPMDLESEIDGPALEGLVFQILKGTIESQQRDLNLYFWRTVRNLEVDFILYGKDGFAAIEVMRSSHVTKADLKSLIEFKKDYKIAKCFLFTLGNIHEDKDGVSIRPLTWLFTNIEAWLDQLKA